MPQITVQEVVDQVAALLDAEGSEHYTFDQDYLPNINGVQDQLLSVIGQLLGARKFTEEGLRELNKVAVFQTNAYGEIDIDECLTQTGGQGQLPNPPHKLWTVVAVYPEFDSAGDTSIITIGVPPPTSLMRGGVRFIRPIKDAKRYTQEQHGMLRKNVFMQGNQTLTGEMKTYGYFIGSEKRWTALPSVGRTITIFPHTTNQRTLVAVAYLKVPSQVTAITDSIEWPESMRDLIVQMVYRRMAFKQGDGTTAYGLSSVEMNMLAQALS